MKNAGMTSGEMDILFSGVDLSRRRPFMRVSDSRVRIDCGGGETGGWSSDFAEKTGRLPVRFGVGSWSGAMSIGQQKSQRITLALKTP